MFRGLIILAVLILHPSLTVHCQTVHVVQNLWRLEEQEDTDKDRRITVHDDITPFQLQNEQGRAVLTLSNVYELSVLLQELKRAEDRREVQVPVASLPLSENIVERTHRLIKDVYWDALTRRIDAAHLDAVLPDPKVRSKCDFLYVSTNDEPAMRYFKRCELQASAQKRSPPLKVVALPSPEHLTGSFVHDLEGEHGLLSLKMTTNADGEAISAVPYVVPGGRFNELYYWDSYFIVLGLLADDRTDLARAQADNLIYELQAFGKIPNANRTYYLTRSQPPLLTSMIRAVYDAKGADNAWLASALKAAIIEYRNVWMGQDRLVKLGDIQLNRYFDSGNGPSPEVEPGHYDEKIRPWLDEAITSSGSNPGSQALTPELFLNQYNYCGKYGGLAVNGLTLDAFFEHDRALRESGHDTTHRFDDRTMDFLPCEVNAMLYKYEIDFAEMLETNFAGKLEGLDDEFGSPAYWRRQAAARKRAMDELMWDETQGFYFDYDYANRKRSTYISATGLFPLWAGMLDRRDARDQKRAVRIAEFASKKLEEVAGLASTAKESVESARAHDARQWDYPFGWPPHQIIAWQGLRNYGLNNDAERLAYRWLHTIVKNAHDYNGTIPEKYNVVTGSHDAFVEYGNVGTKFAYIAPEGFGWMNASFEVGLKLLSPRRLEDLKALVAPPLTQRSF